MLPEDDIRALLAPFELQLTSTQIHQVIAYLDLLLRWNEKINLTAIRSPEEAVTRHFGESLYLTRRIRLEGSLLDIGSGAGFPGLALRIAVPDLNTVLLEPVGKKGAFLKEVARACGIDRVEVRGDRLEDYVLRNPTKGFDTVTVRAVGDFDRLLPTAIKLVKPTGRLCLWVSRAQGEVLKTLQNLLKCDPPIKVPLAREREIWVGKR